MSSLDMNTNLSMPGSLSPLTAEPASMPLPLNFYPSLPILPPIVSPAATSAANSLAERITHKRPRQVKDKSDDVLLPPTATSNIGAAASSTTTIASAVHAAVQQPFNLLTTNPNAVMSSLPSHGPLNPPLTVDLFSFLNLLPPYIPFFQDVTELPLPDGVYQPPLPPLPSMPMPPLPPIPEAPEPPPQPAKDIDKSPLLSGRISRLSAASSSSDETSEEVEERPTKKQRTPTPDVTSLHASKNETETPTLQPTASSSATIPSLALNSSNAIALSSKDESHPEQKPSATSLPSASADIIAITIKAATAACAAGITQPPTLPHNRFASTEDNLPLFETMDQLRNELNTFGQGTFEGRLEGLFKSLQSFQPNPVQSDEVVAWLTINEAPNSSNSVYLKIVIKKSPYFSKAFHTSCFPESASAQNYSITCYESLGLSGQVNLQLPLMRLRVSQHDSELVWIGAGEKTSGTQVTDVYQAFESFLRLNLKKSTIYDDSKRILKTIHPSIRKNKETGQDETIHAFISVKLSQILGSPDGKTWYEKKLDHKAITCKKWKMDNTASSPEIIEKEKKQREDILKKNPQAFEINQNDKAFAMAVKTARGMKLCDFRSLFVLNPSIQKRVTTIVKRCLETSSKDFQLGTCQMTIHELEASILQRYKTVKAEDLAALERDHYYLHSNLYFPWEVDSTNTKATPTKQETAFWVALKVINKTTVFQKVFS